MRKQQYPEPTVGGLVFNPEGKALLVRSHKWKGNYTVPGGHIELGERMEDALVREMKEETGLDVYDLQFALFQEFIYDDAFFRPGHFIFFDFACRADSDRVILNEESEEYVWVSLEEALKLPIDAYVRRLITHLKATGYQTIRPTGESR